MKSFSAAVVTMFFILGCVVWITTPLSRIEWYHLLVGLPCSSVVIFAIFDWVKERLE